MKKIILLLLVVFISVSCKKNKDNNDPIPLVMPTAGLVAFYPFSGNANDGSGYNNHGTVNGATLTSDRSGSANSAYVFSGGDYITAPTTLLPNGNNPRTVSLWVKTNGSLDSDVPVCWGMDNSNNGYGIAMGTSFGTPKGFRHFGWGNDVTISYNYPDNQWLHLAGTYDGSTAILYVNGAEVGKGNKVWDTFQTYFFIGKNLNNNSTDHFNGCIDEVRIYNRALTATEVNTIYQIESPK